MRRLLRGGTRAHVWLYRVTRGKLGGRIGGAPILLLTTVGRRSGRERTLPLGYLEDSGKILICAANVGADRHPGWFWNLKATPTVRIEKKAERITAVARVAEPEERKKLWPRLTQQLPALEAYQRRTDRALPVVVLTPRGVQEGRGRASRLD